MVTTDTTFLLLFLLLVTLFSAMVAIAEDTARRRNIGPPLPRGEHR